MTSEEITAFVSANMPDFVKAVASDVDVIIMSQGAFGTTEEELFTLAVAIKYAGIKGKTLTIVAEET